MACKAGIYRGELTRHLVNCTSEDAFNRHATTLRHELQQRGYPRCLLPPAKYDHSVRQEHLRKLARRDRHAPPKKGFNKDVLVMKLIYTPQLRHLRIRQAARSLIARLRESLGSSFLANTKLVIANNVATNLFRATYKLIFSAETSTLNGNSIDGWG